MIRRKIKSILIRWKKVQTLYDGRQLWFQKILILITNHVVTFSPKSMFSLSKTFSPLLSSSICFFLSYLYQFFSSFSSSSSFSSPSPSPSSSSSSSSLSNNTPMDELQSTKSFLCISRSCSFSFSNSPLPSII